MVNIKEEFGPRRPFGGRRGYRSEDPRWYWPYAGPYLSPTVYQPYYQPVYVTQLPTQSQPEPTPAPQQPTTENTEIQRIQTELNNMSSQTKSNMTYYLIGFGVLSVTVVLILLLRK